MPHGTRRTPCLTSSNAQHIFQLSVSLTVSRVHSKTLHTYSSNQCNTVLAGIKTHISCQFKSCSSCSSSLYIDFQMMVNASFTNINAAVHSWLSEMWGVFLSVPRKHSSLLSPLISPHLTKVQYFSATLHFPLLHIFFIQHDDDWCAFTRRWYDVTYTMPYKYQ